MHLSVYIMNFITYLIKTILNIFKDLFKYKMNLNNLSHYLFINHQNFILPHLNSLNIFLNYFNF